MIKSIILAGGSGSRMKSKKHKVLHKIYGKALIEYVLDATNKADVDENIVIVGHQKENVLTGIEHYDVKHAVQEKQLGTGHAVMMARKELNFDGHVMVLSADTPLVKSETLKELVEKHKKEGNTITVATTRVDNPTGYGRIIRREGKVYKIREHKDCNDEQLKVNEINTSIYIFRSRDLLSLLDDIKTDNSQGEYYLTDTIEIALKRKLKVGSVVFDDDDQFVGINTKRQLIEATNVLRNRVVNKHLDNGVIFIDPTSVQIGEDVEIGQDTIIYPNVIIEGKTIIGEDCEIGQNTTLKSMVIGDNVSILQSVCLYSTVGANTTVGPFAYIRPECVVGEKVKVGDFVELKKAKIGNSTKMSHLSYVGDAEVGENCNIGCGTITVNYDGKNKFKTIIGNNVFVGCNSNLVAPVTIESNSYVAAGTTVTSTVHDDELAISRVKQSNIKHWVSRKERLQK